MTESALLCEFDSRVTVTRSRDSEDLGWGTFLGASIPTRNRTKFVLLDSGMLITDEASRYSWKRNLIAPPMPAIPFVLRGETEIFREEKTKKLVPLIKKRAYLPQGTKVTIDQVVQKKREKEVQRLALRCSWGGGTFFIVPDEYSLPRLKG